MKNREYLYRYIIPGMDISLLTTTNDIEQLRTMALAMVRRVVSDNAEKERRIRLLEEALMLARQQRFRRKTEMLSGLQRQLFEEDTEADIAAAETQLNPLQQQDIKKKNHQPLVLCEKRCHRIFLVSKNISHRRRNLHRLRCGASLHQR